MPDLMLEKASSNIVIGIDEAGRGPWAGPVTVTALWLNPKVYDQLPPDINDSKKIKPARRKLLAERLKIMPNMHCTISKDVTIVDKLGILQTTLAAMTEAATKLIVDIRIAGFSNKCQALIDGNIIPTGMPCSSTALVQGDGLSMSIAGASIIAKHSRDCIMEDLDVIWPEYGWRDNKGYGTRYHQLALGKHGISPQHRRSFAPIRRLIETALLNPEMD